MDMSSLVNCMGTLFLLLAVGFLCNKIGILCEENKRILSKIVVNVALPGMLINAIITAEIDLSGPSTRELVIAIVLYYVTLFILSNVYAFFTARKHPDKGVYQYMVMFSNTGFLGIPLITAMFGQEALFHVALFNIPFNIMAFTYGIFLIRGKGNGEKRSWKKMLTPPTVSSVLSLVMLLLGLKLPVFLADAVGYIGGMTVPGAMMVVGASLAAIPAGAIWKEWRIYAVSVFTLLIRPVIIVSLAKLFITDPLVLGVTVILAAVPVGANTTSLCIQYDANEKLASCGLFVSTMLSMFTIPLVAMVLL